MSFLGFCLLILAAIAVLLVATAVTVADRRLHKHGVLILLYRLHTGLPHHGQEVTDAGWLRPGTKALTRTGHATRFQHRPRLHRTLMICVPELAALFAVYGLLAAPAVTAICLLLAASGGGCLAAWRVTVRLRMREHRRSWLEPAHKALAVRFGHALASRPESWLNVALDRSEARLALPPGKVFDPAEQAQLARDAIVKLGITGADASEDAAWKQTGLEPHVTITRPVPCPRLVTYDDLKGPIEKARPDEIVLGIGKRGIVVKVSLAINAPHILASLLSGVGKSTLAKLILAPQLHKGAIVLMLDIKQWSHPWFYGLDNVAYCHDEESIFRGLMWLGHEIERRNSYCAAHVDVEGRVHGDPGPKLIVCVEEINELMTRLRRWWEIQRDSTLPARCPGIDVLDKAHFLGRQVKVHVVDIGQMVTARAAGSGESRENSAGIRLLGQPTPQHWKMLVAQHPFPGHVVPNPGRVYVVTSDAALETQIGMMSGADARELAVTGVITECPRSMPGRAWHPRVVTAGPVTGQIVNQPGPDQGFYQPAGVPATPRPPAPDGVTLKQAVDAGLVGASLANMRMLRFRRQHGQDNKMPVPLGYRGTAEIYDPVALADWWGWREAARLTKQGGTP